MGNRKRTTWGIKHRASSPPAVPGYGMEDQDHPAHQDDPSYAEYGKGDTSAWAEDVHPYPYPEGNPPMVPGYDTEDQDHPAHSRPPRVPKEARQLTDQIKKKAAKCLVLAKYLLGKNVRDSILESQALDLMDLPDRQLEASLKRLGGGFLAMNDMEDDMMYGMEDMDMEDMGMEDMGMEDGMEDDMMYGMEDMDMEDGMEDDMMYGMEDDEKSACGGGSSDMYGMDDEEDVSMAMSHMANRIKFLERKLADQNDSDDSSPDVSEEEKETTATKKAKKSLRPKLASFAQGLGFGPDGFALKEDWEGSRALFAALDRDRDGIVSSGELVNAMFNPSTRFLNKIDHLSTKEASMLNLCGKKILKAMEEEDEEEKTSKEAWSMHQLTIRTDSPEEVLASLDSAGIDYKVKNQGVGQLILLVSRNDLEDAKEKIGNVLGSGTYLASDSGDDDEDEVESSKKAWNLFAADDEDEEDEEDEDEEDEDEDDDEVESSKKAWNIFSADDEEDEDEEDEDEVESSKKAWNLFAADDEDEDEDEEGEKTEKEASLYGKGMSLSAKDENLLNEIFSENIPHMAAADSLMNPQPRKKGRGVKNLGQITRTASTKSDNSLSNIWKSDPDVSEAFGMPSNN